MKTNTNTHDHYQDSIVDVRFIEEFGIAIFCTVDAELSSINTDNPLFNPSDLVEMYSNIFDNSVWSLQEDKEEYIKDFCDWLIENGCDKEDLGLTDEEKPSNKTVNEIVADRFTLKEHTYKTHELTGTEEEMFRKMYELERSARYDNLRRYAFDNEEDQKKYTEWKKTSVNMSMYYGGGVVD